MRKILKILYWIIGLGLVVGITVWLGNYLNLWRGFPHGSDAYCHLSKIKFILDYWPNTDWFYHWAMGMPHFLWYAPLPYYMGAGMVKLFGVSQELSLNIIGLISYLGIFIGIFGAVYTLVKNHLIAF